VNALELAERALAHAVGDAQVTVTRERSLLSRFARSAPTQATAVDDVTIHVLAWRDGHTGAAATNLADDASLRDAAVRADAAARASATAAGRAGDHPGPVRPAAGGALGDAAAHDAATAALDPDVAGTALATAFEVCGAAGLEAFGVWTAGEVESAIASTAGVRASERVTDAYMKVIARDARGRSGWASGAGTGHGAFDAAALARDAAAKVRPEDAAELPPGEYPVVLAPDALGSLLDFLGDLAFNGLAHAEGRGALSGRLGATVAAPGITLADAPRSTLTLPRAFDAEGTPKDALTLIEDGVARRVVHDSRSAARAGDGAASTGHATAPGGSPYGPSPTNLVLAGGDAATEAELLAPIERGIYVTRLWYVNPVNEHETLLTGTTRDGTFLIEDGRIVRPLRDVRFTDSVLRILAATEALTSARHLACEADHYGRRFAYGVVCPALRASGFRVTGVSPA